MARTYAYPVRRILVLTPPERRAVLFSSIGVQQEADFHNPAATVQLRRVDETGRDLRYRLTMVHTTEQVRRQLRRGYFNVLVIDEGSSLTGGRRLPPESRASAEHVLEDLMQTQRADPLWRVDRTLVLLEEGEDLQRSIFTAGRMRVGGFAVCPVSEDSFMRAIDDICRRRESVGKTALCLAGGGIEGLIYEIGVLRALDRLFVDRSVCDFDIFCGISAGSIAASFLANGLPPDELSNAFRGDSSLIAPVTPRTMFDPAYGEFFQRLWRLGTGFLSPRRVASSVTAHYLKSVPTGFFGGERIREFVRTEFERSGRTNDFRQLGKELYIGVTDQDTSEHVIFGDAGWDDVNISDAVRASTALVPFYRPAWLRGRWFVDGSYTRTSELQVAVDKGAKLVVIVDPLVPIRSGVSGYVRRKGGMFAGIQALKAMIHTRFVEGYRRAAETHPDVDFLVIVPEQDDMRLMSGSPVRYRYRMAIDNLAYQATLQRFQEELPHLSGELMRHGIQVRAPGEIQDAAVQ